jgi:hypothetical protein
MAISVAVCAGVGFLFGMLVLTYHSRNDARRFEVSRQLPNALVVQGRKDAPFLQGLGRIAPMATVTSSLFAVAFDRDGISLWKGSSNPERFTFIPASDVREVSLGEPFRPSTFGSTPYSRLKLLVNTPDGVVDLEFAVEHIPGFGIARFNLNEAEIAVMANDGGTIVSGRRPDSASMTQSASVMTLIPGTTAWAATRRSRIATWAYFLLAIPLLVAIFAIARGDGVSGAFPLLIIAIFVIQGTNFLFAWMGNRISTRERAAGYTTLNAVDLDLPQVNPRSGQVIRPAGGLALSKDEFKRQLLH